MKELSIVVKIDVNNTSPHKVFTLLASDFFDFDAPMQETPAGLIFNCDKNVVIDMPESDVLRYFSIPRSCIVTLRATDGTPIVIGNSGTPAKVTVTPLMNVARLSISCKMMQSPFL